MVNRRSQSNDLGWFGKKENLRIEWHPQSPAVDLTSSLIDVINPFGSLPKNNNQNSSDSLPVVISPRCRWDCAYLWSRSWYTQTLPLFPLLPFALSLDPCSSSPCAVLRFPNFSRSVSAYGPIELSNRRRDVTKRCKTGGRSYARIWLIVMLPADDDDATQRKRFVNGTSRLPSSPAIPV